MARAVALRRARSIGRDGRLGPAPFGSPGWESVDAARANAVYAELEGLPVKRAQAGGSSSCSRESGDLVGEPRPITHAVKYYERGRRPLEIVTSWQWYVRTLERRHVLFARGRELNWHPEYMRARYEAWVEGLTGDWNISRRRFFGVPFPVWYRLDDEGEVVPDGLLLAPEDGLPVDPSTDVRTGYTEDQRAKPGGFVGDPDVMDTWATSSLTPQIAGKWEEDPGLFDKVFPMDLRPQAHEIIRTWLFSTVVRSELEHSRLPWRHAAISGWILDPDRKKIGKSLGNADNAHGVPRAVQHRRRALLGGIGPPRCRHRLQRRADEGRPAPRHQDPQREPFRAVPPRRPEGMHRAPATGLVPLDAAMLARLAGVVDEATAEFDAYDHARALEITESFFWSYCDDYLELVKARAYGEPSEAGPASARHALAAEPVGDASGCSRRSSPTAPRRHGPGGSPARSTPRPGRPARAWRRWPAPGAAPELLEAVGTVLVAVRRAKTEAKGSMRARWPAAS